MAVFQYEGSKPFGHGMSLLKTGIFHTIPATNCPPVVPGVVFLGWLPTMSSSPSLRHQHTPYGVNAILFARFALAISLGSIFVVSVPQLRAQSDSTSQNSQDVAEAARREQARRQEASGERHVYTNEDLRRGKILTQADQTRAAAAKQKPQPGLATKPDAQPLDANSGRPQEPLGDVARRYRNLRREAVHPSPFHLPANQPELAAPKMLAPFPALKANSQPQPPARTFALVNPSAPVGRAPSFSAPAVPSAPLRRIDPFSRRRQPIPPAIAIRPSEPRTHTQPNLAPPNLRSDIPSNRLAHLQPSPAPVSTGRLLVVRPGDTLWALSREHLGRGTRWLELMAANPNLPDPTRLSPGTALVLPSRTMTHHAKPASPSVTVQSGDTLSKIALATYGHASAWTCVAQANPSLSNPHLLAIGQSLVLPASCSR